MQPILILGAGINGAAIARELALNGVAVVVVDTGDLAGGTTAYSSRLIHGGLRYLEYREFDLVRESLAERTRLLQLAPHLVKPLQLFIPVRRWFAGLWDAARTFLGWPGRKKSGPNFRGLLPIRFGLWMYDKYAQDPTLPRSRTHRVTAAKAVAVDPAKFVRECSYYDAQVPFAERLVVEMFADATTAALDTGAALQLFTYHRAELEGATVRVRPVGNNETAEPVAVFTPAAIINATGAWVDRTLASLRIASSRLIGGTRGTHMLTHQAKLKDKLVGRAIYAEAADGRPVFILPFGDGVLIGTTDDPFDGPPESAVATPDELNYLLAAVNDVLPDVQLQRSDIDLHYCGVRPLPYVDAAKTAAITRRHWLHQHTDAAVPMFSVVGGKLTTCRSLAEETVALLSRKIGVPATVNSRERPFPGGQNYPAAGDLAEVWQKLAAKFQLRPEQVQAIWDLFGTQAADVLLDSIQQAQPGSSPLENLPGTDLPRGVVGWCVRQEWATTLDDLVERRLMLLFHPQLSLATLQAVAAEMVATGALAPENQQAAIDATVTRLTTHFGRRIVGAEAAELP